MAPTTRSRRRAAAAATPSDDDDHLLTVNTEHPQGPGQREWTPVSGPFCDLATYDPDRNSSWTPEPEPYEPEAYAAWGRKHFGDDWYEKRKTMLQERNYYECDDPVYRRRQKILRRIEHKIEGRPMSPPMNGLLNEGWQQLWARLSKSLPPDDYNYPAPSSPSDRRSDDEETDLSGYNTYAPTPDYDELTPFPDDPWEQLKWARKHQNWEEEWYHYNRIFRQIKLIDQARTEHEDEEGKAKELEELQAFQYLKHVDFWEFGMASAQHRERGRQFGLRLQGWTQEQINATKRKAAAEYKANEPPEFPPWTRESLDAEHRRWDALGVDQETRALLARMFCHPGAGASQDSQPAATSPRPPKHASRKTRPGRGGTKAAAAQRQKPIRKDTRSRRHGPNQSKRLAAALSQPKANTMRARSGSRSSRRLAGLLPEFGMLLAPGDALPRYETLQQPSDARKTGPRSKSLPKKRAGVNAKKPQGISKPKTKRPVPPRQNNRVGGRGR